MSIDPDVQAVLEQVDASIPAPGGFNVAFVRAMAEGSPGDPSPVTLAAVEDAVIPGQACRVPVRFYRPEPDGVHPAIVFVHGGGFILRGLASPDEMCRRLAAGTGSVVIAVDCRAAPEHPYPAAVDDAYTAVLHITRDAGALGLDPDRIAIAGISSGAAIAAGTALRCRDADGPRIALQALLTPMLRHREATASRQAYGRGGYGITAELLDWHSDQYAPGTAADDPYCAPLRAATCAACRRPTSTPRHLTRFATTGPTTPGASAAPASPPSTATPQDSSTASTSSPARSRAHRKR